MATKKRIRKSFEHGKVCIRALYNNTIVTLTDPEGNVLAWSSPGANGYKGARQATPYAGQVSAEQVAEKAQSFGMVPNTEWSNPAKTKSILQAQKPKEESYFDRQRIVPKDGGKLYLSDIKKDFEAYVGYTVSSEQSMGNILKNHGMKSKRTNGKTWYSGYALGSQSGNSTLG